MMQSLLYCGIDLIVIAATQVFDPLGCVAATHGEARLRIGRPEHIGSRGDGGDGKSEESQRCSLTRLV